VFGVDPATVCVEFGRVTGAAGRTGWRVIPADAVLAGAVVVDFEGTPEATDDGAEVVAVGALGGVSGFPVFGSNFAIPRLPAASMTVEP